MCPISTQMGEWRDNVAHSSMFYGFRLFPQYIPKQLVGGRGARAGAQLLHEWLRTAGWWVVGAPTCPYRPPTPDPTLTLPARRATPPTT